MIWIWKYFFSKVMSGFSEFCRQFFEFAFINVAEFNSISFSSSELFVRSCREYTIPEMFRLCLIELILLHLLLDNTTKKIPNSTLNRYGWCLSLAELLYRNNDDLSFFKEGLNNMNCSRILNYDKIQKLGYKTRMSNKTRMVRCDFYHPKTCV